jgi:hypothetical protein
MIYVLLTMVKCDGGVAGRFGVCQSDTGTCKCQTNYYTTAAGACGVFCDHTTTCSGHGHCDALGQCVCSSGWSSSSCAHATGCDADSAPPNCGSHGECQVVGGRATCSCNGGWSGSRCENSPGASCPGTTIRTHNTYCRPLTGGCAGPGGANDAVNGAQTIGLRTEAACQAVCDAVPACVGYSYCGDDARGNDPRNSWHCNIFGPGVAQMAKPNCRTIAGSYFCGSIETSTTIGGTYGGDPGHFYHTTKCVAKAGRN